MSEAVLAALGITGDDEQDVPAAPSTPAAAPPRETEQQRLARYEAEGERMPDLCGDFGHPDVGFYKLTTRLLPGGPLLDAAGKPTPAYVAPAAGGTALAFIDTSHELFTRFGWELQSTFIRRPESGTRYGPRLRSPRSSAGTGPRRRVRFRTRSPG